MSSAKTNGSADGGSSNRRSYLDSDDAAPLSNSALEAKLKHLREESAKHSQILTQKLATSQSGQNLLHMGTSLSTLPPDLHSLLQNLHPVLSATEAYEKSQVGELDKVMLAEKEIQYQKRRCALAKVAAELYQDLLLAESTILRDLNLRRFGKADPSKPDQNRETDDDDDDEYEQEEDEEDTVDHAASLERAAHIALMLMEELRSANETLTTALTTGAGVSPQKRQQQQQDTEQEEFLVKLSHPIRRLESDATQCLISRTEMVLQQFQKQKEQQQSYIEDGNGEHQVESDKEDLLVVLGHCMRGLALLGRAKEVENIFARTAIMPLVRCKVSMGRLDEGGARGECAGLKNVLADMVTEIANIYGPVLRLAETMFSVRDGKTGKMVMDVDLLTNGVWVPISTALMADAGIKMAIFSPGIASILQANYIALDNFLSELASRLLSSNEPPNEKYYQPAVSSERIMQAQDRIYAHSKTAEFSKKWNLPIYYQLRFGDYCTRLNEAVEKTRREGWISDAFTGTEEQSNSLRQIGFELSLFLELYDILLNLWRPDVVLRPLTNRFIRGAVQLVGRTVKFIEEGMTGKIMFGEEPPKEEENNKSEATENGSANPSTADSTPPPPPTYSARKPYCWGESEEDVAAVSWELTVLDSALRHDYATVVSDVLSQDKVDSTEVEKEELRNLVTEVLKEASDQIHPIIDSAWNDIIVKLLTQKCSTPLGAVKGVAATYRMTNRPPPTQASPFVATILRSLKEFNTEFANRTPDRVGSQWKQQIIVTVSDRYAAAVGDLIATVQRTEVALKNRKARRMAAGGMSDGEKVKLQLYLDCQAFVGHIREVGIEPATVIGVSKLQELTAEGEKLLKRDSNGS